jgi:hypothetical protein
MNSRNNGLVYEDLLHYVNTGAWCALSASRNTGPGLLLDHNLTMTCNTYSDIILNTSLIMRPLETRLAKRWHVCPKRHVRILPLHAVFIGVKVCVQSTLLKLTEYVTLFHHTRNKPSQACLNDNRIRFSGFTPLLAQRVLLKTCQYKMNVLLML